MEWLPGKGGGIHGRACGGLRVSYILLYLRFWGRPRHVSLTSAGDSHQGTHRGYFSRVSHTRETPGSKKDRQCYFAHPIRYIDGEMKRKHPGQAARGGDCSLSISPYLVLLIPPYVQLRFQGTSQTSHIPPVVFSCQYDIISA